MHPQRFAQVLGLFQAVAVASWMVAWFAGFGSPVAQDAGADAIGDRRQTSLAAAALADALQATARGHAAVRHADVAMAGLSMMPTTVPGALGPEEVKANAEAALTAPSQMPPVVAPPVQVAAVSMPEPAPHTSLEEAKPVIATAPTEPPPTEAAPPLQLATADPSDRLPNDALKADGAIAKPEACGDLDVCIDRYLWAVYERTPKKDSIKVTEQRPVTVKKKGKIVTVMRSFTRLVDEDFAWKDPKAAEKAGLSMMDYVVGGMERSFRLRLFHLLRAAEEAGLAPGITSAFRDDYRQSIASGLKAASDRSYHGGSSHGGYGHGLAADLVSINGETRDQRYASSEKLWKWIDMHGEEFGIGRPYLSRDPPHVAPIDGREYASHRGTKIQHAASDAKKPSDQATRDDHGAAKRSRTARSSKMRTT